MNLAVGLAAAAVVLVGCAPSPPQPAAGIPRASVQGPVVAGGNPQSFVSAERTGGLPSLPWPKFQAGLGTRANEAELAIILRGHELHERHPSATPIQLAEMLERDAVWEQHAKFVQSARRSVVVQEALRVW